MSKASASGLDPEAVHVAISHKRATDPQFADFLSTNVADLHRLTAALAEHEPLEFTHHDSGSSVVDGLDHWPERVAALLVKGSGSRAKGYKRAVSTSCAASRRS